MDELMVKHEEECDHDSSEDEEEMRKRKGRDRNISIAKMIFGNYSRSAFRG